jgi:fatty-acyl-CoA synthase
LVKSGGEWISSVALENAVLNHPSIDEAAVVAQPHPKWGERPLLFAVASVGAPVQASDIRSFLTDRFPRWWVPDTVRFVDTIPKTSVGKIDKKLLRAMLTSEDFQPHASDAAAVAPESS